MRRVLASQRFRVQTTPVCGNIMNMRRRVRALSFRHQDLFIHHQIMTRSYRQNNDVSNKVKREDGEALSIDISRTALSAYVTAPFSPQRNLQGWSTGVARVPAPAESVPCAPESGYWRVNGALTIASCLWAADGRARPGAGRPPGPAAHCSPLGGADKDGWRGPERPEASITSAHKGRCQRRQEAERFDDFVQASALGIQVTLSSPPRTIKEGEGHASQPHAPSRSATSAFLQYNTST
ncbi:hypothetical protein NDU88_002725 [Pleurodeles waltl]|uniref:Uncharacterized protein n=1 Tax=Pleurodeles waltl TaxID=8319 RepID=A0AAV7WSH9_PLEWA|nr:hypothetical protein NDU88_002725 [Pleurodeles waltl]